MEPSNPECAKKKVENKIVSENKNKVVGLNRNGSYSHMLSCSWMQLFVIISFDLRLFRLAGFLAPRIRSDAANGYNSRFSHRLL